ncbi:MAG: Protein yciE, partial [Prosthecobacter sp.]|nr:Protein yciE [Prosthecobacter sp.]
ADNQDAPTDLRARVATHLSETEGHAEQVKQCLHELGADTSSLKTVLAQSMEFMKGTGTAFAKDERIKDMLASYAMEHFEIACYMALRAGAKEAGLTNVVVICESILKDERRMANWLDEHLSATVTGYLRATP